MLLHSLQPLMTQVLRLPVVIGEKSVVIGEKEQRQHHTRKLRVLPHCEFLSWKSNIFFKSSSQIVDLMLYTIFSFDKYQHNTCQK